MSSLGLCLVVMAESAARFLLILIRFFRRRRFDVRFELVFGPCEPFGDQNADEQTANETAEVREVRDAVAGSAVEEDADHLVQHPVSDEQDTNYPQQRDALSHAENDDEERSHDSGDGATGADHRPVIQGVKQVMPERSCQSAHHVYGEESGGAQLTFNQDPHYDEERHVVEEVIEAGVQESRTQQGQKVVPDIGQAAGKQRVRQAFGNESPLDGHAREAGRDFLEHREEKDG